jgi:phosphoribosylamine--glycine ligase
MQNALVIGAGGREHALCWKLAQSHLFKAVYAAPGNPGIANVAQCLSPPTLTPSGYLALADELGVALTVVGPEAPLVDGIVDIFRAAGRRIIGPTAAAARLEGSKAFSKDFMVRAGVPTAQAVTVSNPHDAIPLLGSFGYPVVLKADGLAAGKGVIIAADRPQALEALPKLPPGPVVIEQYLQGEEVSFIVLADGLTARPLAATQDHKAVGDNDTGPNTGGMGAYCDGRILTEAESTAIMDSVIHPTLAQMAADGTPFSGFLYAGLMMTADGPKVLEFNVRLGDPEAQSLIHRLDSDLGAVFLEAEPLRWTPDPSVCVILAAHGYPGPVRTGDIISGLETCPATVFHSGTRLSANTLTTAGGRVLGVTTSGPDLKTAIANAYSAVNHISFSGMHFRTDIGRKGLKRW